MSDIVKVRGRHGTKTLDITIPAKISKENDSIKIIYELVYKD